MPAMESRMPEQNKDGRKPYVAPELKEFGTIAELTAVSVPTGPKNDAATMGFDKSAG
jgi:hypothetical protein